MILVGCWCGVCGTVNNLSTWFPLGLGKREGIFQSGKCQGILLRLEKSEKFTQNTGKIKKLHWKNEKNTGKVQEIFQPVIVKTLQI